MGVFVFVVVVGFFWFTWFIMHSFLLFMPSLHPPSLLCSIPSLGPKHSRICEQTFNWPASLTSSSSHHHALGNNLKKPTHAHDPGWAHLPRWKVGSEEVQQDSYRVGGKLPCKHLTVGSWCALSENFCLGRERWKVALGSRSLPWRGGN